MWKQGRQKGFKQDRIHFDNYKKAVKWARKNLEKFHPDMIHYESVNEILVIVDKFDKNKQEYGKIYYQDGGNRPGDGDIKKANKELAKLSKKHKGLTLVSVGRNSKMYDVNESVNEEFKSKDSTFEKVYGIFDKRDYFNNKGFAKTQIGNFERALQKKDKGAQKILDKFKGDVNKAKDYIFQVLTDRRKEESFNDYKAFKIQIMIQIQEIHEIYKLNKNHLNHKMKNKMMHNKETKDTKDKNKVGWMKIQ